MSKSTALVVEQLSSQCAVHGLLGEVFAEVGGKEFVVDWAQENPGAFIKLLVGATPSLQPMNTIQGDVNLHVHNTLGPTELDVVGEQ
jgi:hypothetical protein